jgi:O-antigen ligase
VLGGVGAAYFAFLAVYLLIGLTVGVMSSETTSLLTFQLYQLGASMVVIYSAAAAARHVLLAYSPRQALMPVTFAALLAVGSVFVGLAWPQLYELLPRMADYRHSGVFANPNEAGIMSAIAAAFAIASLRVARNKLLPIFLLLISGIASVLTFSRTAMVVFVAVLVSAPAATIIIKGKSKSSTRNWLTLLAVVLAAALFAWFLVRGFGLLGPLKRDQNRRLQSVRSILTGSGYEEALTNRREVLRAGVRAWAESPLVGSGLGSALELDLGHGRRLGPHNTWLLVLAEAGIVPVLFLLAFCGVWLRAALRCPVPTVRSVALGFFVVFVLVMLTSHVTLNKRYINLPLGTVIGLLAAADELARRRKKLLRQCTPVSFTRSMPQFSQPRALQQV